MFYDLVERRLSSTNPTCIFRGMPLAVWLIPWFVRECRVWVILIWHVKAASCHPRTSRQMGLFSEADENSWYDDVVRWSKLHGKISSIVILPLKFSVFSINGMGIISFIQAGAVRLFPYYLQTSWWITAHTLIATGLPPAWRSTLGWSEPRELKNRFAFWHPDGLSTVWRTL